MTSENSLAIIEPQYITPAAQVDRATEMANALTGIVKDRTLSKRIGGRNYLLAEAWQTIIAFDQANPIVEYCNPILEDGEIIGYEAKVNIVKHGETLASGIMVCGFDDFPCKGKTGFAQRRAAMSAAQTWAGAKAARTKYAWVVVLAGYAPTPAEEMEHDEQQEWHETRPLPDSTAKASAAPTQDSPTPQKASTPPALTYDQLRQAVWDAGMEFSQFETVVLKVSEWSEWVKHGGTPAAALARWETFKAQEKRKGGATSKTLPSVP